MLPLLWLAAITRLAEGVCYVETIETFPRKVVDTFRNVASLNDCKVTGLTISNAEAVVYNSGTGACVVLQKQVTGGVGCDPGYARHVKMKTGCALYDLTTPYGFAPCFAKAKMDPVNLARGSSPICPNKPIDGESTARLYVVAVITPGGAYMMYDNNSRAQILWDDSNPTNASWVYRYISNGRAFYSEPIYAATCVYYPAGVSNDCECDTPLPRESSTNAEQGATDVVPSTSGACATDYAGKMIQSRSNTILQCGPCIGTAVVCINRQLILTWPDPAGPTGAGQIDSFLLINGTCYVGSFPP